MGPPRSPREAGVLARGGYHRPMPCDGRVRCPRLRRRTPGWPAALAGPASPLNCMRWRSTRCSDAGRRISMESANRCMPPSAGVTAPIPLPSFKLFTVPVRFVMSIPFESCTALARQCRDAKKIIDVEPGAPEDAQGRQGRTRGHEGRPCSSLRPDPTPPKQSRGLAAVHSPSCLLLRKIQRRNSASRSW